MARLEKTPAGPYHVEFWRRGLRDKKSLGPTDERTAQVRAHRLNENLMLVETGRLEPPVSADLAGFLFSDGRRTADTPATSSIQAFRAGFRAAMTAPLPAGY